MKPHHPIDISSIAELVFFLDPKLNFPRLVAAVQQGLPATAHARMHGTDQWIAEVNDSIVTLALIDAPRRGVAVCLTLSVGRRDGAQAPLATIHLLAETLLDCLQAKVCADQVRWLRRCVTRPSRQAPRRILPRPAALPNHLSLVSANIQPDLPPIAVDADLHRLRAALYAEQLPLSLPARSGQMRLAIHAMNATLIVVALPVGVALLTYSLLRGDNLRATTGALVATGLANVVLQTSPFAHLLAFAG